MSDPSSPTPPQDPSQLPPTPPAPPAAPENPYASANTAPAAPLSQADDIQWASFAHLGGILGFLPSLIIWLVFKDRGAFTNVEAKEALNFQITLALAEIAFSIVAFVILIATLGFVALSGLGWLIWLLGVIFSIIAFLQVKTGQGYRYPFALRLIK